MFDNEISPLEDNLPTYFPPGFVRNDRSLWFNRTHIGLQVFYHDEAGHFIRLELSPGPIGNLMNVDSEQVQNINMELRGIKAHISSLKPSPKAKRKGGPPLISADWKYGETYFSLQTDGLAMEEVEKVIVSSAR
jgi:hypothetical protein